MKTLLFVAPPEPEKYPEDITAILDVCECLGYVLCRYDAMRAWQKYSDDCDAGWLQVTSYSNWEILGVMQRYCVEVA